jgi:hypothetical protein
VDEREHLSLQRLSPNRRCPHQAAKRRNNVDIPRDIDVFFIEEHDDHASKIGARGIGELGVAAAIKNAIYHATGKRVRKLPVHIVGLIAHKPVNSGYRT